MTVPEDKAILAIQLLIEGTGIRTAERITQLHRDTILRLLVLAGERCIALMDTKMRDLRCARVQSDEIWTFVGKKERQLRDGDSPELRNAWVFVAIDADTKLIPAYTVGKRTRETTYQFLADKEASAAACQRSEEAQGVENPSLNRFFGGSATSERLAFGRKLAEVFSPTLRCSFPALLSEHCSRRFQQHIVQQRQGRC